MNWPIEFIIKTSHLLVGVNSASNFFIYVILRKNFRAATWRLLTCTKPPENLSVSVMARSQTMRTTATTRLSQVGSRVAGKELIRQVVSLSFPLHLLPDQSDACTEYATFTHSVG